MSKCKTCGTTGNLIITSQAKKLVEILKQSKVDTPILVRTSSRKTAYCIQCYPSKPVKTKQKGIEKNSALLSCSACEIIRTLRKRLNSNAFVAKNATIRLVKLSNKQAKLEFNLGYMYGEIVCDVEYGDGFPSGIEMDMYYLGKIIGNLKKAKIICKDNKLLLDGKIRKNIIGSINNNATIQKPSTKYWSVKTENQLCMSIRTASLFSSNDPPSRFAFDCIQVSVDKDAVYVTSADPKQMYRAKGKSKSLKVQKGFDGTTCFYFHHTIAETVGALAKHLGQSVLIGEVEDEMAIVESSKSWIAAPIVKNQQWPSQEMITEIMDKMPASRTHEFCIDTTHLKLCMTDMARGTTKAYRDDWRILFSFDNSQLIVKQSEKDKKPLQSASFEIDEFKVVEQRDKISVFVFDTILSFIKNFGLGNAKVFLRMDASRGDYLYLQNDNERAIILGAR